MDIIKELEKENIKVNISEDTKNITFILNDKKVNYTFDKLQNLLLQTLISNIKLNI